MPSVRIAYGKIGRPSSRGQGREDNTQTAADRGGRPFPPPTKRISCSHFTTQAIRTNHYDHALSSDPLDAPKQHSRHHPIHFPESCASRFRSSSAAARKLCCRSGSIRSRTTASVSSTSSSCRLRATRRALSIRPCSIRQPPMSSPRRGGETRRVGRTR